MTAVLVTGMSGTGKSSALRRLAALGFEAVDTDTDGWSEWRHLPDGSLDWVWRADTMAALLARPRPTPLFVAGTSVNQGQFADRFDHVVLLSAPADVLLARVTDRADNTYGRTPADRQKILRDLAETEPLLRQRATLELDATQPLDVVVQTLVALVQRT